MAKPVFQNYILLPKLGVRFSEGSPDSETQEVFSRLKTNTHLEDVLDGNLTDRAVVLDTTGRRGAKLIRLPEAELPDLRAQLPGLRIVPEVFYYPQRWQQEVRRKPRLLAGQQRAGVRIRLVEAQTNTPVANAVVVAFTNFEEREGEQATSDAQGVVRFKSIGNLPIDQIFIYPKVGYWSFWKQRITLKNDDAFSLQPVRLDYKDAKNFFYPAPSRPESRTSAGAVDSPTEGKSAQRGFARRGFAQRGFAGRGVRVGVIDTGVGPHPDLTVKGGASTVTNENPKDFADVDEHGTHVSGIIAAHGNPPTGMRGVAPEVDLYAYRVFGKNSLGASNFAIIKAIERAVADGCDLINMSLGGGPPDDAIEDAISFAHDNGVICFVATGNDGRQPVSFPASFSVSLAVGAMGRKGTFPANTTDAPNTAAPFGTDKKNFVAAFSNIGPEVDFIAPGVGIVSTVPGGYAPLSGTSMACPMATGVAARLLSAETDTLAMPRNTARSEAIVRFLAQNVESLGFTPTFEGIGMLFV